MNLGRQGFVAVELAEPQNAFINRTQTAKATHSPEPFRNASPLEGLSTSGRHRTWTRGAPDIAEFRAFDDPDRILHKLHLPKG